MREGDFYPEEIERLRQAYIEFREISAILTGSAWGEHYKLRLILREMGVYEESEVNRNGRYPNHQSFTQRKEREQNFRSGYSISSRVAWISTSRTTAVSNPACSIPPPKSDRILPQK